MKVEVVKIIDDKTFKGVSSTRKKHPKYGKFLVTHKNYLVHYIDAKVSVGESVEVVPCRPISKMKRWVLKDNAKN